MFRSKAKPLSARLVHIPGSRMFWVISVLLVTSLGLAGGGLYYYRWRSDWPIPKVVRSQIQFPIYYPSSMPKGYSYQKGFAKIQNGILFYKITSGNRTIVIGEQAIPVAPPDLSSLIGFKKIVTLAGNAAVGSNNGQPIAIVLSNTTLININGSKNVPNDVVGNLAKSMSTL